MNIFRLVLPFALTLALSINVFAQDDEDPPPRGGQGTVTIITDPPNSDVSLGFQDLGKSPILKRPFPSGRHNLIVIDQGKELINVRFNVWPDRENVFKGTTTMPIGGIKVTTNPDKCHIYLDGEMADHTAGGPLTINSVEAGDHTIGAICPGLRLYEILINVRGEQTTEVHLDARRRNSTVKIVGREKAEE
ncbi:MAG: PEGA domain-containing protein [Fibromonadaceae bacterium]|nr:PEGA domain-containing protein [Fibromonadaceae bacterium]